MVTHRSGAPVTIREVSGDTTRVSPMRGLRAPGAGRPRFSSFSRSSEPQRRARGAGQATRSARRAGSVSGSAAAKALPAEVAFATEFDLPEPMPRPVLEAEGDRDWEVSLDGRVLAKGSGSGPRRFELPGPIPVGGHVLVAVVWHPTGVASIRLRLRDASGEGKSVVTGRGWGADDDASRIRDRGRKGARYRAMVWGRPPLSSWSASSVTSSLSWNGGSSIDVESSRIPSRAEAQ